MYGNFTVWWLHKLQKAGGETKDVWKKKNYKVQKYLFNVILFNSNTRLKLLQYIYLEKLNDQTNKLNFNVDFLSNLSHLTNTPKIEKNICIKKNPKFKLNKFNIIYENL